MTGYYIRGEGGVSQKMTKGDWGEGGGLAYLVSPRWRHFWTAPNNTWRMVQAASLHLAYFCHAINLPWNAKATWNFIQRIHYAKFYWWQSAFKINFQHLILQRQACVCERCSTLSSLPVSWWRFEISIMSTSAQSMYIRVGQILGGNLGNLYRSSK